MSHNDEETAGIWEPAEYDVLSGRGAAVNSHTGNKRFRALCFARKMQFEEANQAAKRRIATEVVTTLVTQYGSRFLKRQASESNFKGPWLLMDHEFAVLKACQVMRDRHRPDRIIQRQLLGKTKKPSRQPRATATPLDEEEPLPTSGSLNENPYGVNDHDVLSGRGALVNAHVGNLSLRMLAADRKEAFDKGNYTEKRTLATEIVTIIKGRGGRFLKRGREGAWEELSDDNAIQKACQVMRDFKRPDRRERDERSQMRKARQLETRRHQTEQLVAAAAGGMIELPESIKLNEADTVDDRLSSEPSNDPLSLLSASATGAFIDEVVEHALQGKDDEDDDVEG